MTDTAARVAKCIAFSVVSQVAAWCALAYALGVRGWPYGFFDVSDISLYYEYATRLGNGLIPYVQWQLEYPPLALPLFAVPVRSSIGSYAYGFAAEMIVFSLITGACVAAVAALVQPKGARPYVAGGLYSLGVLLLGAISANRYDMAVALVLVVVLLLLVRGRLAWAAFVLGIGFALKLTPAVLLPLILILAPDRRTVSRGIISFGVPALVPFLVVLMAGGAGGLRYLFGYHLARPLEIETLYASPLMGALSMHWIQGSVQTQFGSQVLVAPGASVATALTGPVTLVALALVYWLIWRRRQLLREVPRIMPLAVLAVLLAFIVFGKVLSPQYLIWLLPFVGLVAVYRPTAGALLLSATLLTHVLFPVNYSAFAAAQVGPVMLVAVRNVLLAAAFGLIVLSLWRLPEKAPRH